MSLRSVSFKLYGQPPPKGSARSVHLSYIRRIQLRQLPLIVPLFALLLVLSVQTWIWIVFAVGAVLWLESVISLTIRIRRARQREHAAP
jgi:hypothetical protein